MRYLAILYPIAKNSFAVEFPDVPDALTYRSAIEEAIDMTEDTLYHVAEKHTLSYTSSLESKN